MTPNDLFRDQPVSFDDWCSAYSDTPREGREELASAARSLLRNRPAMRVLSEIEKNAVEALVRCPLGDPNEAHLKLSVVHGVRAFRKALDILAQDQAFDEKRG